MRVFATVCSVLLLLLESTSAGVIDLTSSNFDTVVGKGKGALVEFYAPWCRHCKFLAPEYEQVGQTFEGSSQVNIARLNGDDFPEYSYKYGVRGFPSVMWFNAGSDQPHAEFQGERKAPVLVEFVNSHLPSGDAPPPPPPKETEAAKEAEPRAKGHDGHDHSAHAAHGEAEPPPPPPKEPEAAKEAEPPPPPDAKPVVVVSAQGGKKHAPTKKNVAGSVEHRRAAGEKLHAARTQRDDAAAGLKPVHRRPTSKQQELNGCRKTMMALRVQLADKQQTIALMWCAFVAAIVLLGLIACKLQVPTNSDYTEEDETIWLEKRRERMREYVSGNGDEDVESPRKAA